MKRKRHLTTLVWRALQLAVPCLIATALWPTSFILAEDLPEELKRVGDKIVYETYRETNWELFVVDADGSNAVNLTRTPQRHELYPHVSPDGSKICFVSDEGEGISKLRNVYYMNRDGTGRTLVATNARQPCWNGDGTKIAYLQGESEQFCYSDYATKGIFIYDLATGDRREHPNRELYHLYNLCWSPDGKWFLATVHAGMGYRHAILAIEAQGLKVYDLKIPGCRPDISPDGKLVAWGASDWALRVGELDFSGPTPKVVNHRDIVTSKKPMKIYHVDWSPDGRHIAFSRGPVHKTLGFVSEIVGIPAQDWNICVADATKTNHWAAITTDGSSNKEPDWVPRRR